MIFIKEKPLKTTSGMQRLVEEAEAASSAEAAQGIPEEGSGPKPAAAPVS